MNLLGNHVNYLTAFLGGMAVSFTPCVYPLIPVTIGYIGARSSGSKVKGFILSLVYVTGVAITYSVLGLFAVLTGSIFGRFSSFAVTYFFAGAVIMLFGLSMLELFRLPQITIIKLPALKQENYFSTLVLGASSGLIASPCLTPVLGSILVYLTTQKNLFYGATLLFSFAYGMGFILILAGTFSAVLVSLPKSSKWLTYIKKVFASAILGVGLYFIYLGIRRL